MDKIRIDDFNLAQEIQNINRTTLEDNAHCHHQPKCGACFWDLPNLKKPNIPLSLEPYGKTLNYWVCGALKKQSDKNQHAVAKSTIHETTSAARNKGVAFYVTEPYTRCCWPTKDSKKSA